MWSGRRAVDTVGRLALPQLLESTGVWGVGVSAHLLQGDQFISETDSSPSPTISQLLSLSGKVPFPRNSGDPGVGSPLCVVPERNGSLDITGLPRAGSPWKPR